jgi:hypothetical protein
MRRRCPHAAVAGLVVLSTVLASLFAWSFASWKQEASCPAGSHATAEEAYLACKAACDSQLAALDVTSYVNILSTRSDVSTVSLNLSVYFAQYPYLLSRGIYTAAQTSGVVDAVRVVMPLVDGSHSMVIFQNYPQLYTRQYDMRGSLDQLLGRGRFTAGSPFAAFVQDEQLSSGLFARGALVVQGDVVPFDFLGSVVGNATDTFETFLLPLDAAPAPATSVVSGMYVSNVPTRDTVARGNELSMIVRAARCRLALNRNNTMLLLENTTGYLYSNESLRLLSHANVSQELSAGAWFGKNAAFSIEDTLETSTLRLDRQLTRLVSDTQVLVGGYSIGSSLIYFETERPCTLHVDSLVPQALALLTQQDASFFATPEQLLPAVAGVVVLGVLSGATRAR